VDKSDRQTLKPKTQRLQKFWASLKDILKKSLSQNLYNEILRGEVKSVKLRQLGF
jgi:hypothetical protein